MPITALQFKHELAEFRNADDGKVRSALRQAELFVDPLVVDSVTDAYWATIYLAAHFLSTTRALHGSIGDSGSSIDNETYVQSVSIGDRRVTLGRRASGAIAAEIISGQLDSTTYGNLYWMILRRHTGGPVVV